MDEQMIEKFLEKRNVFAVVGASRNPMEYSTKFTWTCEMANILFILWIRMNMKFWAINAMWISSPCLRYRRLLIWLFPQRRQMRLWKSARSLESEEYGYSRGSESRMALDFCRENDIEVVYGICAMIERRGKQLWRSVFLLFRFFRKNTVFYNVPLLVS